MIDQVQTLASTGAVRQPESLAEILNTGDDGTFERLTTEDKLDISLHLIGLSDDQLAAGGLTRDGILDFVFGADALDSGLRPLPPKSKTDL